MTDALSTQDAEVRQLTELDTAMKEGRQAIAEYAETGNAMGKTVAVMNLTLTVKEGLRPLLPKIKQLANTPLGFVVDRAPGKSKKPPYSDDELLDALTAGAIQGARFTDNELAVIGGKPYLCKAYFRRCLAEVGASDVRVSLGVPQTMQGGALCPAKATWRFDGKQDSLACLQSPDFDGRLVIKTDDGGGGTAAIHGKAEKKVLAKIYAIVTGSPIDEADEDSAPLDAPAGDTIDAPALPPASKTRQPPPNGLEPSGVTPEPPAHPRARETAAEKPQTDSTGEPSELDRIKWAFETANMVRQADQILMAHMKRPDIDDDARAELVGLHRAACDRIRGARGDRSNQPHESDDAQTTE